MGHKIRTLRKPEPCWLNLVLFIIFAFGPMLLGLDIIAELAVLAAIGPFAGRIGGFHRTLRNFIVTMLICAAVGIAIIGIGIIFPQLQYRSIAYWGDLYAVLIGVFVTCFTASVQFTKIS